jgi:membrane protein DedA with SNARE-associated domain
VMVIAGTLLYAQEKSIFEIILVVFIATVAKTLFAVGFYQLAALFEDRLPTSFLRWVGYDRDVVRDRVEHFSKGKRDDVVLLLLRLLPILPSLPVSLVCGFLKLDYKTYVWTSFVGFGIKNAGQLLIGYYGLEIIAWIG